MHRSEVPDCFYAGIDHSVRNLLRSIRGYGDDAYLDIESLDDFSEFGHVVHGLTVDFGVDYSFVFVKRRHDVQAVVFKTAVAQKRLSESAYADQNGVVSVVVAEETFKVRNYFFGHVTHLRFACDGGYEREVLSHLHGIEVESVCDGGAGYCCHVELVELIQIFQIRRQSV